MRNTKSSDFQEIEYEHEVRVKPTVLERGDLALPVKSFTERVAELLGTTPDFIGRIDIGPGHTYVTVHCKDADGRKYVVGGGSDKRDLNAIPHWEMRQLGELAQRVYRIRSRWVEDAAP